ncbi:CpXC domain-containing protein [Allobaculum mucilyticum]|uniref:CpXC domain-containing protein n=1 Tax=Allobaculum mucilyticum TaxID=2834459 RepID=UPI001E62F3D1|nr:CpXC domain-containing protein [Allobaculum mucilyticum]UNT95686.1 CpXC domain-containing protein [Allobaculum mucilyticum]
MKKRMFEFVCPFCHSSFFLARDTYLIRDPKSTEYKRLKDGHYFTHQCQKCMHLFELEYPLVWRDPQHGFSLILSSRPADSFEGRVILTRRSSQFLEAFSILDLGLDLQEGLKIKRQFEAKTGKPCRMIDYDAKKQIIWVLQDGELAGIRYLSGNSATVQVK